MVRERPRAAVDLWLAERYGWCPDVTVARRFQQLLEQATEVLYRAIYVRDHVFTAIVSYRKATVRQYGVCTASWRVITGCRGRPRISTSRVTIRKYRWKTSRELRKRRMR